MTAVAVRDIFNHCCQGNCVVVLFIEYFTETIVSVAVGLQMDKVICYKLMVVILLLFHNLNFTYCSSQLTYRLKTE